MATLKLIDQRLTHMPFKHFLVVGRWLFAHPTTLIGKSSNHCPWPKSSHFKSNTLQCPSASLCDRPTYFWRSLNFFHFPDILSRMLCKPFKTNLPGQTKNACRKLQRSVFDLRATSGMHNSKLTANVDEGIPLAVKAKVGSSLLFHSQELTERRVASVGESDPNFCLVDFELKGSLHFESVGSAHLLPSQLLAHKDAHGVTKSPLRLPSPGVLTRKKSALWKPLEFNWLSTRVSLATSPGIKFIWPELAQLLKWN